MRIIEKGWEELGELEQEVWMTMAEFACGEQVVRLGGLDWRFLLLLRLQCMLEVVAPSCQRRSREDALDPHRLDGTPRVWMVERVDADDSQGRQLPQ
jgi:hypothetical protein